MFLSKLTQATEGQELTFVYNSGTSPGRTRRVRIQKVSQYGSAMNEGYVVAEDLEDDEQPKNFSSAYATNIQTIDEQMEFKPKKAIVNRVSFIDVRRAIEAKIQDLTSEDLAKLYEQYVVGDDQIDVEFDVETGDVVVSEPEIKPYFRHNSSGNVCIVNQQKHGLVLDFEQEDAYMDVFYTDESGDTVLNGLSCVSPQDLVEILMAHLELDT